MCDCQEAESLVVLVIEQSAPMFLSCVDEMKDFDQCETREKTFENSKVGASKVSRC